MLVYCDRLNELFQDISQLSAVHSGPFGEVPDPRFLQELRVHREDHREIFRRWFREHAIKQKAMQPIAA